MKRPTDQRRTAASSSKLTATGPGPRRIDPLHPTGCEWKANGVGLIEPFILAVFNKLPEKSRCVLFQRILNDCVVGTRWRAPMIRLLFTALLCALASSQATAQNWVSEALLGLNEDQRNETFTYLLRDGNAKCDWVIRTLFIGSTVELDDWEVLCRDRNSYSLTITPEQTPSIELVSCRELLATSKMLLERAGSKSKATGCRIERAERLHGR